MRTIFYQRFNFICILLLALFSSSSLFAQSGDSIIYRDDFNRAVLGNAWEAGESWSIVDGSAFNFIDGTGGTLTTSAGYPESSYVIRTTGKGFTYNHGREFRITFGQADLSVPALYEVKYTADGGGQITLAKSTDNVYFPQVLDEAAIFPAFNSFQWYDFKIAKYKSGLIQVYIDQGQGYGNTPVLEAIDSTYPQLGHSGWQIDTQAFAEDFYVDFISAAEPDTEKPAVREKPAEDSLITQVSAKSRKPYTVSKLNPGVKQFIDRDYTITTVPDYLKGASFIQTANDDKFSKADSFLTFFVKAPSILYVGYDHRSTIPLWLNGWTKTGDKIGVGDDKVGYLDVYSKSAEDYQQIFPHPLVLGGNVDVQSSADRTNYLVAAIKRPDGLLLLQAEDAALSGATVATNHTDYVGTGFVDFSHLSDDYIEWTVPVNVPGSYNLDFRFANGSLKDRLLKITDNGTDAGTADFLPTFSWNDWEFTGGADIYLTSGVHKIRITTTGTGGPNIDELRLFFESPVPPAAPAQKHFQRSETTVSLSPVVSLGAAYPNPFLQSTKIYYNVKQKAKVALSIFNLQGQQIQLLESGVREAGIYQSTFNAGTLAKGVYIYKLQIGNEVKTGKLIKD